MTVALRAVARFFRNTIGWNRIGMLLSLSIIVVAVVVLYRTLRHTDVDEVIAALKATKPHQIALAMLFVVIGYASLTFYDLFALRSLCFTRVPYRIAALTGFTSYSIGHNVGASAFSGGAVRYRIYSSYGLTAVDVTKVCFVAGLTFWLGNATVLGLGVLYVPLAASAIDQLPIWLTRVIAIGILAALGSYIAWVSTAPRILGRGGWQVQLPGGFSTLVQIGIGILDLSCCALAMYMLLPDEPDIVRLYGCYFRDRDDARICEPRAGRPRGLRCGDAGGALAIRQGAAACRPPAVSLALLPIPVCGCAGGPRRKRAQVERPPERRTAAGKNRRAGAD